MENSSHQDTSISDETSGGKALTARMAERRRRTEMNMILSAMESHRTITPKVAAAIAAQSIDKSEPGSTQVFNTITHRQFRKWKNPNSMAIMAAALANLCDDMDLSQKKRMAKMLSAPVMHQMYLNVTNREVRDAIIKIHEMSINPEYPSCEAVLGVLLGALENKEIDDRTILIMLDDILDTFQKATKKQQSRIVKLFDDKILARLDSMGESGTAFIILITQNLIVHKRLKNKDLSIALGHVDFENVNDFILLLDQVPSKIWHGIGMEILVKFTSFLVQSDIVDSESSDIVLGNIIRSIKKQKKYTQFISMLSVASSEGLSLHDSDEELPVYIEDWLPLAKSTNRAISILSLDILTASVIVTPVIEEAIETIRDIGAIANKADKTDSWRKDYCKKMLKFLTRNTKPEVSHEANEEYLSLTFFGRFVKKIRKKPVKEGSENEFLMEEGIFGEEVKPSLGEASMATEESKPEGVASPSQTPNPVEAKPLNPSPPPPIEKTRPVVPSTPPILSRPQISQPPAEGESNAMENQDSNP